MNQACTSVTTITTNRYRRADEYLISSYVTHRNRALVSRSLKVLGGSESANMLAEGGTLLWLGIRCQDVVVLNRLWTHCVEYFLEPRKNERDEPLNDDYDEDEDEDQKVSFRRMERNFHHVTGCVWRELIAGNKEIEVFVDDCKAYFHEAAVVARQECLPSERPLQQGSVEGFPPSPTTCI